MRFHRYSPPPLRRWIESFWLIEGGQSPRKERILPCAASELVINLHEDEVRIYKPNGPDVSRYSGAVISGAYSHVFACDALQHWSMLGVHFKPGGACPFLGLPAGELADAHANLGDLWGRSAVLLREQLCTARSADDRFRLMERALLARLTGSPGCHPAVEGALYRFGADGSGSSVREAALEMGLSHRRFAQLFASEVGLPPKLYCRVRRFQRARTMAAQQAKFFRVDWATLAPTCGYYDQSHLIRDFQELAGINPGQCVLRQPGDGLLKDNHLPLAE